MNKALLTIVLSCWMTFLLNAQNTVGLLTYDYGAVQDGYNLFFPHAQTDVWLIDNCGKLVNKWEGNHRPGNSVFLKDNGNLVAARSLGAASNPWIHAGGGGEFIEERDWNNNLVWKFTYNDSLVRMHHDFAILPNGNILFIAWEKKTAAEAIAAGRDPALLPDNEVWPDNIIEIKPTPSNDSATIVWEWKAWDHLVQEFDNTKANFGVVANHPEKINLNHDDGAGDDDWLHANSVAYNADLDQIVISVPAFNEFWIIDHSTTTAEAAGSTGGNSGKGGDLLYRWGNPLAYNNGDSTDQKLFFQHDVTWIDHYGVSTSDPDYGKIILFNNRVGADYSTVNIIDTPVDASGNYTLDASGKYGPSGFDYTYQESPPAEMYSTGLSGVQKLPNGNLLICSGRQGEVNEVTPAGQVIWTYINPIIQGAITTQGQQVFPNTNFLFRMLRYPPDFPGFVGKDMAPGDYIEMNPDPTVCDFALSNDLISIEGEVIIAPNPTSDIATIDYQSDENVNVKIYNVFGQTVYTENEVSFPKQLNMKVLPTGLYFLTIDDKFAGKLMVE